MYVGFVEEECET